MKKVFVKNIPFKAKENDIIQALSGFGPISNVQLNAHRIRKNCNSGSGYVEFVNEKDAHDCIAKTPFNQLRPKCMGRPLQIFTVKTKKKVKTESDPGVRHEFVMSSLEIGNWTETQEAQEDNNNNSSPKYFTFLTEWIYPEHYVNPRIRFSKDEGAIFINGFNYKANSPNFNPDPDSVEKRIKIPFSCLAENSQGIFLDPGDGVISLYICLKQPPYLYRENGNNLVMLMMLSPFLGKQTRIVEWIRTVDRTGIFGRGLVYRLIFNSDLDDLRQSLSNFKFKGIPRPIPQIMIRCIEKPVFSKDYSGLLPFSIRYKLESLISYGILRPYELEEHKLIERLIELSHNENQVMYALNQLPTKHWDPFDVEQQKRPITIFDLALKHFGNEFNPWYPSSPNFCLKNTSRCAWVNHATITPTNIYYDGPSYEQSNRILRLYQDKTDHFIRVSFRDENFDRLFLNKDEDVDVINMIMDTINNGFHLNGRHYEFLAFSSSQLKESSCWFVASNGIFDANFIRSRMGDFSDIKAPALYAARMGQCFTSTMGTLELSPDQIRPLEEIKNNKYKFSDGCGKISASLAKRAAIEHWGAKIQKDETPSVFQIRLGGSKGVVAVDQELEGDVLYIRPSQKKFESDSLNLEIVKAARNPLPGHLNRQFVSMLSTLGVPDEVFITLQEKMKADIDSIVKNKQKARKFVKRSTGTRECYHVMRTIISMIDKGMMRKKEPFLQALLECKRVFSLKLLRCKARISVPDSFLLMGVIDETGSLEENQIYVQTSTIISENQTFDATDDEIKRETKIWTGSTLIIRNPSLHPGDFRQVEAVDVPKLSHLKNCVVFSKKGDRPLPNLLSGGDLDGDEYFVCFDKRLFISKNEEPMDYDPPKRKTTEGGRPVEIADICEFFKDFMLNNKLGQISNLHLALADYHEEGGRFEGCKMLAQLQSKAVDFNKTGVPVTENLTSLGKYPDFMEKTDKESYESEKALGQLYRNIQLGKSDNNPLLKYDVEIILDEGFLFDGYRDYVEEAIIYRDHYNREIRSLMNKYKVKTEAEIVTSQLLEGRLDSRNQDIREAISGAISVIIYNFRKQFLIGLCDTNDNDTDIGMPFDLNVTIPISDESKAKASAWYYVTYNKEYFSSKKILLSFPWVVADVLLTIKDDKAE